LFYAARKAKKPQKKRLPALGSLSILGSFSHLAQAVFFRRTASSPKPSKTSTLSEIAEDASGTAAGVIGGTALLCGAQDQPSQAPFAKGAVTPTEEYVQF